MAKRSAKSPRGGARGRTEASEILTFQRLAAGGATAFAIAFSYVAVNALWYQPRAHSSAFFATRAPVQDAPAEARQVARVAPEQSVATIIRLEAEEPVPPPRPERQQATEGDLRVRAVQQVLATLKLYSGPIDGLTGPQTRDAVEDYQKMVGLEVTGTIDAALLTQLGANDMSEISKPRTAPAPEPVTDEIETASAVRSPDTMIMRIQAGLKAFGNDGIAIDGVVGENTVSALKEFQSLFGLPVTGKPDPQVYAKMKEIGLLGGAGE